MSMALAAPLVAQQGNPPLRQNSAWTPRLVLTGPQDGPPAVPPVEELSPALGLPQAVSLADLENLALNRHPALAQAGAEIDAARGRWVQAGLRPNPQIGYSGQEIGNQGTAGVHGAFVSREFITADKLGLSQARAAQEIRAAEANWEAIRTRVLADVRMAYINALVAQERLRLAQEIQRISDDGARVANAMVRAQESAPVDEIQAQIEAYRASVIVTNAQAELDGAWRRLSVATGGEGLAPEPLTGTLEGNIPDYEWQPTLERILNQNPLLAAAEARINAARWNFQRQLAQPVPNVNVQAGVAYSNMSNDPFANLQFSVPIPVNDANQGAVQAARAEIVAAERDRERIALGLERSLADTFAQYQASIRQAEWYQRDILRNAARALELITGAYQQGERDYIAVLTAQRTLFDAKLQYLTALQGAHQASIRLEFLLLDDALTR